MSEAVSKPSPKAARLAMPRWLDAKLLLGVLLVVAAMLLGAKVFATADDTVAVYQVKNDMFVGDQLTDESVVVTRVKFGDGAVAGNYLSAGAALPPGQVVNRDLRAGEMLTQSAIAAKTTKPTVQLSVPLSNGDLAMVTRNSRIDVIVVPDSTGAAKGGSDEAEKPEPTKVLSNVLVTGVPGSSGGAFSSGGNGGSSITVRVDPTTQQSFDPVKLAASLHDSTVFVVKLEETSP